jgi:biopolymer transport protein ExbD
MGFARSIRSRKGRKKLKTEFELQLTSMMDVLVIILVFLLKSYSTALNNLSTVQGIKLPVSLSKVVPRDSLQVIITPEGLTFENQRIVDFVQMAAAAGSTDASSYTFKTSDIDENGNRIVALYDALVKAKEKSELIRQKAGKKDAQGNPVPFDGILAIQADKSVRYDIIRKIMYTGAASGYQVFRLLAKQKEF